MIQRFLLVGTVFVAIIAGPQIVRHSQTIWHYLACVLAFAVFFLPGAWPRKKNVASPGAGTSSGAGAGAATATDTVADVVPIGRWLVQALAVFGFLFLFLDSVPVGNLLGRWLVLPHSTENADAIVILASGVGPGGTPGFSGFQRFFHGYKLLREKRAPRVFCSMGDYRTPEGFMERDWVASFAGLLNLTPPEFEYIEGMIDTRGEAETFARKLIPQGISRILLVTNGGHILRATRVFEKNGFVVLPAPVQTPETIGAATETGLRQFHAMTHEWLGLVQYWMRGDIRFPFGARP
ncbi:MAG: YdcF family protein [Candidatus Ozemobacteraceae bacterium]